MTQYLSQPPALQRLRMPLATLMLVGIAIGTWLATHPTPALAAKASNVSTGKQNLAQELSPAHMASTRELSSKLTTPGNLLPVSQALLKARIDLSHLGPQLAARHAAEEEAQARPSTAKPQSGNNHAQPKQISTAQNANNSSENSSKLATASLNAWRSSDVLAFVPEARCCSAKLCQSAQNSI